MASRRGKRGQASRSTFSGVPDDLDELRGEVPLHRETLRASAATWDGASLIQVMQVPFGESAGEAMEMDEGAADEEERGEDPSAAPASADSLHRPCASCRAARVLCDRHLPCGRCVRLGQASACSVPPTVKRGRPTNAMRQDRLEKLAVEAMTGMPSGLKPFAPTTPAALPPQQQQLADEAGASQQQGLPPVATAAVVAPNFLPTPNGVDSSAQAAAAAMHAAQMTAAAYGMTTAVTGMPHQVHGHAGIARVAATPAPPAHYVNHQQVPMARAYQVLMEQPKGPEAAPMAMVTPPVQQHPPPPIAPAQVASSADVLPTAAQAAMDVADQDMADAAKLEALRMQLRAAGIEPCV